MRNFLMPALMLSATLSLVACSGGTPTPTNTVPVANFTITPTSGPAPVSVSTTNTSSDADAGETATLSYDWNWGDSTPNSTATAPTHTFTAAGTYTVTLTAKDVKNATSTKTATVTVTTAAPVAPTVLSVSPVNGSVGNAAGAPIVVTFSKPMDASVTAGAYIFPAVAGTTPLATTGSSFVWSAGNTVLTVTPTTATTYATTPGTAAGTPNKYSFSITTAAKSDASAGSLVLASQLNMTFSTAVEHTGLAIFSDPFRDQVVTDLTSNFSAVAGNGSGDMSIGDNAAGKQLASYLTFDLSTLGLPAALTGAKITAATLKVVPSGLLNPALYVAGTGLVTATKQLSVFGLVYGTSFAGTPATLQPTNELASNLDGSTAGTVAATFSPSVLSAVKADWDARATQSNLSQFQLRFPAPNNGGGADQQKIFSGQVINAANRPTLSVNYLADN